MSMIYCLPANATASTSRDPTRISGDGYSLYTAHDGDSWVYLTHWSPAAERMLHESRVQTVIVDESWGDASLQPLVAFAEQITKLSLDAGTYDLGILAEFTTLQRLGVHGDPDGVPFSKLTQLRECTLSESAALGSLHEAPSLESLDLYDHRLQNLRVLAPMTTLRSLSVGGPRRLSLNGIEGLALKAMRLSLPRLESFAPLAGLSLKTLHIADGKRAIALHAVGEIVSLQSLELDSAAAPASLHFVSRLSALRKLDLSEITMAGNAVSVAPLLDLPSLTDLSLWGGGRRFGNLSDVELLGEAEGLECLRLSNGAKEIGSIAWVRSLTRLREFRLHGTRIRDGDLTPLLRLPLLRTVSITPLAKNYTHNEESFVAVMNDPLRFDPLAVLIPPMTPPPRMPAPARAVAAGSDAAVPRSLRVHGPMTAELFWKILDRSRQAKGGIDDQSERLMILLAQLHEDDLFEFDALLQQQLRQAYRWDLWAVAFIAKGGCSDDAFDYFCAWLVAQGRAYFEASLANPSHAAHRIAPGDEAEFEMLLSAAAEAYGRTTAKSDWFDRVDPIERGDPEGEPWEEDDLSRLFPRLVKKFM